jgi:hypothetical protein
MTNGIPNKPPRTMPHQFSLVPALRQEIETLKKAIEAIKSNAKFAINSWMASCADLDAENVMLRKHNAELLDQLAYMKLRAEIKAVQEAK